MSTTDFVYGKARVALAEGTIDLLTANVNAMLVTNNYGPIPNTDQYVSTIPSGAIVVRDYALTSKGISSSGIFYGVIPTFNTLTSSDLVSAVVLYIKGASDAVSQLLYYSSTGVGFPFTPQGFDYVVGFDQSSGGYFQI